MQLQPAADAAELRCMMQRTMITECENMELKFYGDLLSSSCRAVAIFMKINGIPYIDMNATAVRRGLQLQRCDVTWQRWHTV